jgi:hypothetical protein
MPKLPDSYFEWVSKLSPHSDPVLEGYRQESLRKWEARKAESHRKQEIEERWRGKPCFEGSEDDCLCCPACCGEIEIKELTEE